MTANKPLHTLFSRFLHAECFQSQWQSSFIVPIFKSGVKSDVRNYRGISILSAMPKIY